MLGSVRSVSLRRVSRHAGMDFSVITAQADLRILARCCTASLIKFFYTEYQDHAPVDLSREYSALSGSFDFVVFDSADSVSA
jgi:hypothetical protein